MKVAYINGIILNGSEDMRPQKGMMILTEGEKIESVVPQTAKAPDGYQQVDLNGRYIMPGLINMHLHLPASGRPTPSRRATRLRWLRTRSASPPRR